jgi:hypothetical protein
VTDFLTAEWFAELNETLAAAGPVPFENTAPSFRLVIEFPDAPRALPHAMTFSLGPEGASVDAGDHLAADALLRLSFADATALTSGQFDSATALREGRIKVRGDINAIVPVLSWIQQAHPHAH